MKTPPGLDALGSALEAQAVEVAEMFEANPEDALVQRPSEKRWSVAEHVEHLTIVNEAYLASIRSAVGQARDKGWLGEGPFRRRWLAEKLIESMEPPPKRKVPAFRSTVPQLDLDFTTVLARFENVQKGAVVALEEANGVDLGRAQLRSPLFPLLKLSAMQGFRLIDAHNRRHIWHMKRTVGVPGP